MTTLGSKYNTFKTTYTAAPYTYSGAFTPATSVVITQAAVLTQLKDNPLKTEVDLLSSVGNQVATAADEITKLSNTNIYQDELRINRENLRTQVRDPLEKNFNIIFGSDPDYFKSIKSSTNSFLIGAIVIIIVFTVLFLVILVFTAFYNKLHCLKFVQKIIMILQLAIGILILLFSMFGIAVTVGNYYGCYALDGIMT